MKKVCIAGGGLAGLMLGVLLRHRGLETEVSEVGDYPRHRVCGEFISGKGQRVLELAGLKEALVGAGMREAQEVRFCFAGRELTKQRLPEPAWTISRYALDALLARRFEELGGELRIGQRVTEAEDAEGAVRATGRVKSAAGSDWKFVGLKVHAENLRLQADLEMHCGSSGYFGLCRLSEARVNVCALLRSRENFPNLSTNWLEYLLAICGEELRGRFQEATFDPETFCATASLDYASPVFDGKFRVGDAGGLIAPITGNGMSMAFESAALAVEPLATWAAGAISWRHAVEAHRAQCEREFATRLRWGRRLQALTFSESSLAATVVMAAKSPFVWQRLIALTR